MKTKTERSRKIYHELNNDEIERILAKALNDGSYNPETVTLTRVDLLQVPKTHVITIVVDEEDEVTTPAQAQDAAPQDETFVPPQEKYISDFMNDLLDEAEIEHDRLTFEGENERLKDELARANEIISKARPPVTTTVSSEDEATTMTVSLNDIAKIISTAGHIVEEHRAKSVSSLEVKLSEHNGQIEFSYGHRKVWLRIDGTQEDAGQAYFIRPDGGTSLNILSVEGGRKKRRELGDGIYRVVHGRMDKLPPDAQIHIPSTSQVGCPAETRTRI